MTPGVSFLPARNCARVVAALLLAIGLGATARAAPVVTDPTYGQPQRRVGIGGRALNLDCRGAGPVTVVLDSGLADPTMVWGAVQPELARRTRVCAYDRAGIGFSDPAPRSGDSRSIVADLRKLLRRAGERGPYVLVGHSYGAMNVRLFAYRHPRDVAGLVLVDPSHEDAEARYAAVDPEAPAARARRLARVRTCDEGSPPEGFRPGDVLHDRCVVPAEPWFSADLNGVRRRQESLRSFQRAQRAEVEALYGGQSPRQLRSARHSLGDRPLVVLSRLEDPRRRSSGSISARDRVLWDLHADLARDSSLARHGGVAGSGHYIQLDRPDVIVDAVVSVIDQVVIRAAR